ncbi:DNA methyltransferase [Accumulibacter sp.]|uniref:Eco57I restriction-modification methylase domain-containing protein n=1 Tax=Accumulibacter sp. TaxID=2053492 RepID=UPI00338D5CEF
MMQALDKDLRGALEKTVKAARTVAETAAHAAVDQLGVGHDRPEAFLSDAEKALRNRLRTHGKQLGDARDSKSTNPTYGKQEVRHLVQEVAYQHWHRMLFARFLADNNLLMYDGVAVTIDECDALAPDEGAKSGWELAGKLAACMLPQVFKPGSPVFELTFAPEHQSELERLLKDLPDAVFKASDSLGWVYQFWQADNKERINKSEVKIGADELPAVTQLFTEPYMVSFLLDNSLGACWAARNLVESDLRAAHNEDELRNKVKIPGVSLDYLRFIQREDGTWRLAAGTFENWPKKLSELKTLDPCCGSGHFLVAAFLMLVPMRMALDGLSAKEAVDAVLSENIYGLELDQRCVEIAAFALAITAWRYPGGGGFRELPPLNLACSGLSIGAKKDEWLSLAGNDKNLCLVLEELYNDFKHAPILGSLINPEVSLRKNTLFETKWQKIEPLLSKALADEKGDEVIEMGVVAKGLARAASILADKYHCIFTNPPFLGLEKQCATLEAYVKNNFPFAKRELALCFFERVHALLVEHGTSNLVLPGEWTFVRSNRKFREKILRLNSIHALVRLGKNSFVSGIRANPVLIISSRGHSDATTIVIDSSDSTLEEKPTIISSGIFEVTSQKSWETQVDSRFLNANSDKELDSVTVELGAIADARNGLSAGDGARFESNFWEVAELGHIWDLLQSSPNNTQLYAGMKKIVRWESECGEMAELAESVKHLNHAAQNWRRGKPLWGKSGVVVSQIGAFTTHYTGAKYDGSCFAIAPNEESDVLALLAFAQQGTLKSELEKINPTWNLKSPKTLLQLKIDLGYWEGIAEEVYPTGIPKPYSDDPTQWIFHGHPQPSTDPLQVAVARLVGYTWPAESDDKMELSDKAHQWIGRSKTLAPHADNDGIVCIPPLGREASASDRLVNLLADAYGTDWSKDVLAQLLRAAAHAGKSLETWLRDKFFTQHCALFGNRPFAWHIWDGLRDGFAALVNYHKLDYKALEALIYTYLGDWISRQKRDADNGVDGAQEKLAAAEGLKKRLELILAGEAPYDLFVRWKPLEEQPIGWNPDLNDGVRLNIRPFLSVPDVGKRGAGVLRDKPKSLHWEKDRGADPADAPWYELGPAYGGKVGDRINDHHLTLAEKRAACTKPGKA